MRIEIDSSEVRRLAEVWKDSPEVVHQAMRPALQEASLLVVREARELAPRGATGLLRNSIIAGQPTVAGPVIEARVGTSIAHAVPVEFGRRAGQRPPPVAPIAHWARARLGLAADEAQRAGWAISRAIARRGIPPRPFLSRALADNRDRIVAILARHVERLAQRLATAT